MIIIQDTLYHQVDLSTAVILPTTVNTVAEVLQSTPPGHTCIPHYVQQSHIYHALSGVVTIQIPVLY